MRAARGGQVCEVARRSFLRSIRQPATIVPSMIFPLFLLAVNTAGLDATTNIPGFPTDSYLSFALAVPFIQGAIFALLNSGTDLATDIETGFLNRLALTPLGGAVAARRDARRRDGARAGPGGRVTSPSASPRAPSSRPGSAGSRS